MPPSELNTLSVEALGRNLRQKEISPVALVNAYLERIQEIDKSINAFITVMADQALADARRAERELLAGDYKGPLHGVPIAVKDLYDVRGVRTTAGSKIFSDRVPGEDAPSIANLRKAGAIILGKTNLHELAYGATSDQSAFGPTRNPWATDRIPGGSSGGSGAAVASGMCAAALGSDTGGSIRIPAALCGVVGFKPTYGRISSRGLVPLSWTMDHPGPITRTVHDAALLLGPMAGYDPRDPTSVDRPAPDFTAGLRDGVRGIRIAVDRRWALERIEGEVKTAFESALATFEKLKAEIVEVTLPQFAQATDAAATVLSCEAAALYEEALRTHPQDFGEGVRTRLEKGFPIRGIDYGRARHLGECVRRELETVFETVNLIASPTCGCAATRLGQVSISIDGEEMPVTPALTRFTRIFNFTGLPAISVPCGFSRRELPIGLQLAGAAWEEALVLRAAYSYEEATDWHRKFPQAVGRSAMATRHEG